MNSVSSKLPKNLYDLLPSKRQDCRECLEDEMSEMAEKVVIEESESRLQLSS